MIELGGSSALLQASLAQHGNPVGDAQRLFLIVGHQHRGDAELALDAPDLEPELAPERGVEIRERLVEEQEGRLDDEGARERDPLLLSAGKRGGCAMLEPLESYHAERPRHPGADLLPGEPSPLEAERDVLEDVPVGEQSVALEHHPDVSPLGR